MQHEADVTEPSKQKPRIRSRISALADAIADNAARGDVLTPEDQWAIARTLDAEVAVLRDGEIKRRQRARRRIAA
jgi:hypothetical protein